MTANDPTPEDVYRAAAEKWFEPVDEYPADWPSDMAAMEEFRAAVDAAYAAGHVDGTVAERSRLTRIIRSHINGAGLPLSASNALSRIVDEMESVDG